MNDMNRYCIKNCQFLQFKGEDFYCDFYSNNLEMELTISHNSLRPLRIQECIDENRITPEQIINLIDESLITMEGWLKYIRENIKMYREEISK